MRELLGYRVKGIKQAVLPLIDALRDADEVVRVRAADALGNLGDAQAVLPKRRLFMLAKRPSLKDIIDRRGKESFVGRADYIRLFSENFATEVPRFLLFFVIGEGGVGKSTLLKQYEAIGIGPNVKPIVVISDDEQLSPVAAMGHISEQLARHGLRSDEFDERYKTYRTRRNEIEADPKAPRGALSLVLRGMTAFSLRAARRTPGLGVFAEYIDERDAGEALAQGVNYLIDRIGNKDEVELLREPERVLTPLFISLPSRACEEHNLVLMFDAFERTREALEPWLLELLDSKFGAFDTALTFVISGRDAPDQAWTRIASSTCRIALEPFTLEETRIYLIHRGITDEQLVTQIHEDTGGLPVLVELLAGTNPQPGLPLPDITKDAVKRFLQWIPEEKRRRVALLAAVPRQFNLDILAAALGCDAASSFSWLSVQSYIRTSLSRGWFYHEKVRQLMLRYLRNTMPGALAEAHARLVQFFVSQQDQLGHAGREAYESETWRRLESERVYHSLCAQPQRNMHEAINAFFVAFRWRQEHAENITYVCSQAALEMEVGELSDGAVGLNHIYTAYEQGDYESLSGKVAEFLRRDDLSPKALGEVYALRGYCHLMLHRFDLALLDLDQAIASDVDNGWAIANRGQIHRLMGRYEQALADSDQAIALNENDIVAIANRGKTYYEVGRYAEALSDFDRAVQVDDKYVQALASRGETYRLLGRSDEALADFTRAIEIDPDLSWAIASRGETYHLLGRFEEALADFTRAIEIDPNYSWAIASRGDPSADGQVSRGIGRPRPRSRVRPRK